jgi:hypothetical protein
MTSDRSKSSNIKSRVESFFLFFRYIHIEPRRGHLKRLKNIGKCL